MTRIFATLQNLFCCNCVQHLPMFPLFLHENAYARFDFDTKLFVMSKYNGFNSCIFCKKLRFFRCFVVFTLKLFFWFCFYPLICEQKIPSIWKFSDKFLAFRTGCVFSRLAKSLLLWYNDEQLKWRFSPIRLSFVKKSAQ